MISARLTVASFWTEVLLPLHAGYCRSGRLGAILNQGMVNHLVIQYMYVFDPGKKATLMAFVSVQVVACEHRNSKCFHAPNRGRSTDHRTGVLTLSSRAIQPQGQDLPSGYNAVMRALEVFPICGVAKHTFTMHASACVMITCIVAAVREVHLGLHLGGCICMEKDLTFQGQVERTRFRRQRTRKWRK
jgi:hypothetical protein